MNVGQGKNMLSARARYIGKSIDAFIGVYVAANTEPVVPPIVVPPASRKLVKHIKNIVCERLGVSWLELISDETNHNLSRVRQILMYLLYVDADLTYRDAGRMVLRCGYAAEHGIKRIGRMAETDQVLQRTIASLRLRYLPYLASLE